MLTQYFLNGINSSIDKKSELARTIAKITAINGGRIDCKRVFREQGEQELSDIPLLKNPYFNTPIFTGDYVLLFTLSHEQQQFWETGELDSPLMRESYFAIPYAAQEKWDYDSNDFALKTKEAKTQAKANDSGVELKCEALKIESKSAINFKGGEVSLFSVLNALISLLESGQTGICGNGAPTTILNPSLLTQLNQIKTDLQKCII